jgi:aspartate kinase
MKFGGTSVGTAERIRESAAIVRNYADRHQIIVVVSALAGITDIILKAVQAAKSGAQVETEAYLADLEVRHLEAIGKLLSSPRREEIAAEVGALHRQLRDFCSALMMLRSATPQVLDVALPMGEQISARIFAAYLKQIGARGEFIDSAHAKFFCPSRRKQRSPWLPVTAAPARVACRQPWAAADPITLQLFWVLPSALTKFGSGPMSMAS